MCLSWYVCGAMEEYIEIFTLVSGLVYLVLEISQKNAMWIVGMITSAAAVYMFAGEELYASSALNMYYFIISGVGLVQWRKDRAKLERQSQIHLNRLSLKVVLWSAVITVAGTAGLVTILESTGDSMPWLDAPIAVLNAVATWWLSRSYYQQWYILIFVNILSSLLCFSQELYWMTAQYVFYSVSSVFGLLHWKRNGIYV